MQYDTITGELGKLRLAETVSSRRAEIRIKTRVDEIAPFVELVQRRADTERDALGFLPHTAYEEAAIQGKLWIATVRDQEAETYVGHLLFGGAFPTIRVFQLFVDKAYRRCGVGSALVGHLVADAEAHNYLGITAKVADDLEANQFWERKGFLVVRSKLGARGEIGHPESGLSAQRKDGFECGPAIGS
jgi:GNAT superfamily N-acetyltransferase